VAGNIEVLKTWIYSSQYHLGRILCSTEEQEIKTVKYPTLNNRLTQLLNLQFHVIAPIFYFSCSPRHWSTV